MSKLDQLVRHENAHSGLAFRKMPYGGGDREALLIDLLALANAQVAGPRLLVLGVHDEVGGKRRLKGVNPGALVELIAAYRRTVAQYIEPALEISMRSLTVQDRTVAVIVLGDCGRQPYVVRESLSKRVRRGDGWIRRGTEQARLGREDLEAMFKGGTLAGSMGCEIQVLFAGRALSPRLELPALSLSKKPSEVAGERIRGMLEAKQAAHDRLGQTNTQLNRLAHARLFGADKPYETHTPESLLAQLAGSEAEHAAADRYYEYELRAHKVNLLVVNLGDGPLNNASLILEIPAMDGVDVARRMVPAPSVDEANMPLGYPTVESTAQGFRIQSRVGRIDSGARLAVFRQPLRLLLRQAAVGRNLPFDYIVLGKELREPLRGSLHVQITEDTQRFSATG